MYEADVNELFFLILIQVLIFLIRYRKVCRKFKNLRQFIQIRTNGFRLKKAEG